jgi:hypothetical protein
MMRKAYRRWGWAVLPVACGILGAVLWTLI